MGPIYSINIAIRTTSNNSNNSPNTSVEKDADYYTSQEWETVLLASLLQFGTEDQLPYNATYG